MVGVGQRQYLIGYTDDLEEKADELRAAGFEPMRDGPEQNWGPKVRQISVAGGPPTSSWPRAWMRRNGSSSTSSNGSPTI